MLLWFVFCVFGKVARVFQFLSFVGWLILVYLGLDGLGVSLFLVCVFLCLGLVFVLFVLFCCWIVFGVVFVFFVLFVLSLLLWRV